MRTIPALIVSTRWFLLAAALLLGLALWLRLAQIDRRPLHADEGVQAYQTWQLLRGDGYTYDPTDKHGPFLYYFSAALTKLTGGSAETLTDRRLRGITLLAGLATLTLLLANARAIDPRATLVATLLITTAPLAILYDTYYVQEAWFGFFTWALVFAAWRYLTRPTLALAALIGLLAGLLQVTKETSVLHFAALAVAATPIALDHWRRGHQPRIFAKTGFFPSTLLALALFLLTYVAFYSAGFTRWSGVLDGLRTYTHYFDRAGSDTHSQPWFYYLSFFRPQKFWGEPLLLGFAILGVIRGCRKSAPPLIRFIAIFTFALLFIYSAIPYKMPWLLLTPYIGLCLLAAHGVCSLRAMWERARSRLNIPNVASKLAPTLLSLALVSLLLFTNLRLNRLALDRYANDPRNSYLFQQTSADVTRLLQTLAATPPTATLAVISPDHAWPLPWYLRNRTNVGYFQTPPADLSAYDLALLDTRLDLPARPDAQVFGLRPNVLLWLTRRQP